MCLFQLQFFLHFWIVLLFLFFLYVCPFCMEMFQIYQLMNFKYQNDSSLLRIVGLFGQGKFGLHCFRHFQMPWMNEWKEIRRKIWFIKMHRNYHCNLLITQWWKDQGLWREFPLIMSERVRPKQCFNRIKWVFQKSSKRRPVSFQLH